MTGRSREYEALMSRGLKRCTICSDVKALSEYSPRNARGGDSLPRSACKPCCSNRAVSRRDPLHNRRHLLRKYKLRLEDYEKLIKEQDGRCAICKIAEHNAPHRRFSVDHDHATGKVRGLLCFNCNTALGKFNDDASVLIAAAEYLEKNK